jgi:hypothetical protein
MSRAFDHSGLDAILAKRGRRRPERGSITVTHRSVWSGDRVFVRLDGRHIGVLVGDKSATAEVDAGTHIVTASILISGFVLSSKADRSVSRAVSVGPGERLTIVFGVRKEAARQWKAHARELVTRMAIFLACQLLALGFGWFGHPYLREAIAHLGIYSNVSDNLLLWLYWPVQSRFFCAMWFCLLCQLTGSLLLSFELRARVCALRAAWPSPFIMVVESQAAGSPPEPHPPAPSPWHGEGEMM